MQRFHYWYTTMAFSLDHDGTPWLMGNGALYTTSSRDIVTAVDPDSGPAVRPDFRLGAGVLNPFNPSTTISFSIAVEGPVRLTVYDAAGRTVKTPV